MAESAYVRGEYPKVKELIGHANIAESWVLKAKILNVMGDKPEALSMLQKGFADYQEYVSDNGWR